MPKSKRAVIDLRFPILGLDAKSSYRQRAPYSTPGVLNVWPVDPLENRERGGSRPGLTKAYAEQLGSGNPVRMLRAISTINVSTGAVTKHLMASANGIVYLEESGSLVVFEGNLTAEDESDLLTETGDEITLETSAQTLASDRLIETAVLNQKVYFADNADRVDYGIDGTISGTTLDDVAAQDWTSLGIDILSDIVELTANTGVDTITDGIYYISSVSAGSIELTSSPGSGSCTYTIRRGVKVASPAAKSFELLVATSGQVPHGCPLLCRYRNRLMFAGHPSFPHLWYMSRQGTPTDYSYGDDVADIGRAMYGSSSGASPTSEPITALIPRQDSYVLLGGDTNIWIIRGDPAAGGEMYTLSETIGVLDASSWCEGPTGEVFILSRDGLYVIPAGAETVPESVSRERLPTALRDIDVDANEVMLVYDVYNRGILIVVTPTADVAPTIYWLSLQTKSFWQLTTTAGHRPHAVISQPGDSNNNTRILWGSDDGYVRYLDDATKNDDGTAFTNYVVYGPIRLAKAGNIAGMVVEITGVLDENSDAVTWKVVTADTAEGAVTATRTAATGTWSAGRNSTVYPRVRGGYFCLTLTGQASLRWAVEEIQVVVRQLGRHRTE